MECPDTVVEEAVHRDLVRRGCHDLALQDDEFAQFVEASKHPPRELRQVSSVATDSALTVPP